MGNLSQYFCEKSSLQKAISALRNSNDSEVIHSKEEEIQIMTRNAYLYATGLTIIAFIIAVNIAWICTLAETLGMNHRILFTAAIYDKAMHILCFCKNVCVYMCVCVCVCVCVCARVHARALNVYYCQYNETLAGTKQMVIVKFWNV